jgi:hypothetical protein
MTKKEIIDHAMTIPGMVSEWDCDCLYDHAQEYIKRNGAAIEIGGWKGRSTYVVASVCAEKNATLFELDTFMGVEDPLSRKNEPDNLNGYFEATIDPHFEDILKNNVSNLPVVIIKGDSKETIKEILDRSVDYCFIDGNHEAPMVDEDIKNCLMKVKIGGLVTGHDHGNPDGDVHGAVQRILGTDWKINFRPLPPATVEVCLTIWDHIVNGHELDVKL